MWRNNLTDQKRSKNYHGVPGGGPIWKLFDHIFNFFVLKIEKVFLSKFDKFNLLSKSTQKQILFCIISAAAHF